MARKTLEEMFDEEDRPRREAEEAERARLEELNKTDPAAVCRKVGHDWISVEAPALVFCRHCGAERPV